MLHPDYMRDAAASTEPAIVLMRLIPKALLVASLVGEPVGDVVSTGIGVGDFVGSSVEGTGAEVASTGAIVGVIVVMFGVGDMVGSIVVIFMVGDIVGDIVALPGGIVIFPGAIVGGVVSGGNVALGGNVAFDSSSPRKAIKGTAYSPLQLLPVDPRTVFEQSNSKLSPDPFGQSTIVQLLHVTPSISSSQLRDDPSVTLFMYSMQYSRS